VGRGVGGLFQDFWLIASWVGNERILTVGSWYDGVEGEMATRNPDIASGVDEQARLEWERREIQVGIDEIERGEFIEFASIEELHAEIDRIWDEVEQEGV
jgi:hypothetical protein